MIKKAIKGLIYTCLFVMSVNIFNIEMLNKNFDVIYNMQTEEDNSVYNDCKNVRKEELTWKYKVVNNKKYRRLYNKSTCKWAGNWELVS